MIWTQEGIDKFIKRVTPPNQEPPAKGMVRFDDGIPLVEALAIALNENFKANDGGNPVLEALSKKCPEAVEASMPEAEKLAKESA